jgi:hypothetical protein
MPPNSASSIVSGLHSINANVGFCQEMADTQNYSRTIASRINELALQQTESLKEISRTQAKLSKARKEQADSVVLDQLEEITALDSRLDNIEARITDLNNSLMKCTQNCKNTRNEIQDLRSEKMEVSKQRRTLAASHTKGLQNYAKKKALVIAINDDLNDQKDAIGKLISRINSIKENFLGMYNSFGKMEGARAGLQFKSSWDQNIESLRKENSNFDFKKINTQNTVITTNIANIDSIPTGGAILGYDLGGSYSEGKISLPSYPENMSANVRLSLLGACPVLHPKSFNIDIPNTTDEMKYGMTASYEYPSAFVTDVSVKYNMHKMYQKVVSSGSSGGFFSSRSWTSVDERNYFKDSFSVNWNEQDSANSLTDLQKADLEREMRNNIFARLATIGLPEVSNAGSLVSPKALSKTGAVVLSESLMTACPGNMYCVGAAITLDVLQSIFGNSATSASYNNVQDVESTDSWSRSKVVYKPWISAYN